MTSHAQKKSPSGPMRVVAAVTTFFRGMQTGQEGIAHDTDPRKICFKIEERIEVQPQTGSIPASIGKTFVGKNVEFVVGVGFRTQESNETVPYNAKHGLRVVERPATTEEVSHLCTAIVHEGRSNQQIRAFVAEHWQAMGFPIAPFPSNA